MTAFGGFESGRDNDGKGVYVCAQPECVDQIRGTKLRGGSGVAGTSSFHCTCDTAESKHDVEHCGWDAEVAACRLLS